MDVVKTLDWESVWKYWQNFDHQLTIAFHDPTDIQKHLPSNIILSQNSVKYCFCVMSIKTSAIVNLLGDRITNNNDG